MAQVTQHNRTMAHFVFVVATKFSVGWHFEGDGSGSSEEGEESLLLVYYEDNPERAKKLVMSLPPTIPQITK